MYATHLTQAEKELLKDALSYYAGEFEFTPYNEAMIKRLTHVMERIVKHDRTVIHTKQERPKRLITANLTYQCWIEDTANQPDQATAEKICRKALHAPDNFQWENMQWSVVRLATDDNYGDMLVQFEFDVSYYEMI